MAATQRAERGANLLGRLAPREVLSQSVYDALMEVLMGGTIAPDEPLRVDALARQLGVSQTPIREALPRIEAVGLIVRQPLRGYRVAPPLSPAEVDKLSEARLLIEPYNTARVCEIGDAAVAKQLAKALDDMRTAATGPGYRGARQHLEADAEFHAIISRNCGNRFLGEAVDRLAWHLQRFRLFSGAAVTDAAEGCVEHAAILDAITRGKPEEARAAMVSHLTNARERAEADAAKLVEQPAS